MILRILSFLISSTIFSQTMVDWVRQVKSKPVLNANVVTCGTTGAILFKNCTSASTIPGLAINPAATSNATGLIVTQSGTTSGSLGGVNFNYNSFHVTSDNTNVGGSFYNTVLLVEHDFGGSNTSGANQGLWSRSIMTAPTSATNANRNYVGMTAEFNALSGDGGTNTGAGALGAGYGINAVTNCGGANWYNCSNEFDVGYYGSGTGHLRLGHNVVASQLTQASNEDAAFVVGGTTLTAPWKNGFIVGDQNGVAPLDTSGCVICTNGYSQTIATGVDLGSITITGNFLNSPGGNFVVPGNGTSVKLGGRIHADTSGTYNRLYDGSGNIALIMGGSGDQTNYYRNTIHQFRDIGGVNTFMTVTSAGLSIQAPGSVQLTGSAQPACNAANRGFVWYVAGGTGVKDTYNFCAKDAADVYAWRVIY
jgi:hypothetical protein